MTILALSELWKSKPCSLWGRGVALVVEAFDNIEDTGSIPHMATKCRVYFWCTLPWYCFNIAKSVKLHLLNSVLLSRIYLLIKNTLLVTKDIKIRNLPNRQFWKRYERVKGRFWMQRRPLLVMLLAVRPIMPTVSGCTGYKEQGRPRFINLGTGRLRPA